VSNNNEVAELISVFRASLEYQTLPISAFPDIESMLIIEQLLTVLPSRFEKIMKTIFSVLDVWISI